MDAKSVQHSAHKEIELKLEIDPHDVEALRGHSLFARSDPRSTPQLTVYYDTAEAALKEHGFTLRVRKAGDRFVQTIKPVTQSAALIARTEIEFAVRSIEPDLRMLAGTPLEPLVQAGKLDGLAPIIRSDVKRTSWMVDVGGSTIQLDFDEGEMSAGGRSQQFEELELELVSGEPSCLLAAAKTIAERVPARIGVLSKAERGSMLAAGAFEKITKSAPVKVATDMTVAEAFEVIVHACLRHYRLNEPLAIRGRKKDALHQTRVAMRRLRSAFTLFKPAIEDVEYQYLREELRWFTGQLGEARNLDVFLERELPDADREALTKRREQAYDHVIAAMNSQRFRMLVIELVGWTAFGPWRRGKPASKAVQGFASTRLDRLWHSIAHIGHHIADLDEETRHRLRIQVKKMRYAIEFLRGLYPDASRTEKRFGSAVEELQESLGKLNDLATARMLATAPPADAWLIGAPDEEERGYLREAQDAFRELHKVGAFWRDPHDGAHVHAHA